jgi:histidyl-tRNA synthetase
VPGVGFASGIERIVITLEGQGVFLGDKPHVDVYVVTASNGLALEAAALAHELRTSGIAADTDYAGRGMKAQMKQAAASGAAFVCIIGEDEAASGTVSVKNMSDGGQRSIPRNEAASKLALWREERNR